MNYCIIFDNQKIGIEIPVSSDSNIYKAEKYICNNFLQFSIVNKYGVKELKKGVGYTSIASAKNWGYSIIPL